MTTRPCSRDVRSARTGQSLEDLPELAVETLPRGSMIGWTHLNPHVKSVNKRGNLLLSLKRHLRLQMRKELLVAHYFCFRNLIANNENHSTYRVVPDANN